jgi:alkaline phosphatase D
MTLNRRTFLKSLSAVAVLPAALESSQAAVNTTLFPLGVMAGDMTATSSSTARAILWTRYTGTAPLYLVVWETATGGATVFNAQVTIGTDGFTLKDVTTLVPGVSYYYYFYIKDSAGTVTSQSETGRFRAPIAPGALEVITFGGTSCTRQDYAPFPVMQNASYRELDCFFHIGDHVYQDHNGWSYTVSEFRAKYATNWQADGMRRVHRRFGLYATWDDHENVNNWDPEWVARTAGEDVRLANARKTYFEHHPIRRNTTAPDRLWRSFKWGNTAEFFLLDLRSERYPSKKQYISRAQMDWLKNGLKSSTAVFKFILTPVPVSTFPSADPYAYDRWEGYHAQRTEILSWIRDMHLSGVWWLAGDYHMASVGHLDEYGYRWYGMREVLMGAGGNGGYVEGPQQMAGSAQWDFASARNNYVVYTADPVAKTLRVAFYSDGGTILFDRTYPATFAPGGLTVSGAIGTKYNQSGMVGLLGQPLTSEHGTYDGVGSWQQFQYGYIYWHPNTGAHEIHGAILDRWADEGWSQSSLGYPVTDEYGVGTAGDREQEFQAGWIRWYASTATTTLFWK